MDSCVARDGDGNSGTAAGLAKEAALMFQAGKFADCLRILNQLLLRKPGDPKVCHNIAIAKNSEDGCSDPRKLIEALENVKKQSEKLARASEECSEVVENNGSNHTVSTKGNNVDGHQLSSSSVYSDEFDTSVAVFNIAVIWFHLHEYGKSFSYLNPLYQNIEPIGEATALRICLLLLDVALLSYRASRSAEVITYMEKAFCGNSWTSQVDIGISTQQRPLFFSSKSSSFISNNSTIPDIDSASITNPSENSLSLSEEALEDESLQLLSSLDVSSRQNHLQRPPPGSIASQAAEESSLAADDLRIKLHLYKVRFWLLTKNLKAAKREVKMAMNIARGKDYHMALYLKSQLEYARGNYRKAIKLLLASSINTTETPPGIISNIMYNNNIGCIYYQLGKYHASGVFFSKALKCTSSLLRKEKPKDLLSFCQDKSLLITYNCGVHSLACGRPYHAARCFQTASLMFYNRPLLWLRLAECCIMALQMGLIKKPLSDDTRVNVIGKGKWRQLALRPYEDSSDEGKQPTNLSMSLAWQCLVNALYLLDFEENELRQTLSTNHTNVIGDDTTQVSSDSELKERKAQSAGMFQNSITNYEHIRMKENGMMRQATLADMAYVELELGNPLRALLTAKSLTQLPGCSRMYIFLGTIYGAEALCLLNKPKEAAEHLMMYISSSGGENNVELPYSQEDCEKWLSVEKVFVDSEESTNGDHVLPANGGPHQKSAFPSPEEGRGILCSNYAANLALLGDLDKAHLFVVKALSDIPKSSQAILTAIYVDLKRGKTQDALAKLRHHSSFRFLSGGLTLNGSS